MYTNRFYRLTGESPKGGESQLKLELEVKEKKKMNPFFLSL